MSLYICLLRGINVSGMNKIKMDLLRQLFIETGFVGVQTYIQSGNVIFQSEVTETGQLALVISKKIKETFGFTVPVLVLTVAELRNALKNNPFITDLTKDPAFLHLSFLSAVPEKAKIEKVLEKQYFPDDFEWNGNVIYLYCPAGYGNTKFSNAFFENKLGVTATTRNWKTANELLRLVDSDFKV